MFSLCPHLGGIRSNRGGGQVSQLTGGGVRSSWWGWVRSVSRRGGSGWGGVVRGSQVQLVGGSGPAGEGGGQSAGRGVSILRPLAGGMPLAFTQEDFLVLSLFFVCY